MVTKGFLSKQELRKLISSVLDNYKAAESTNTFVLKDVPELIEKIRNHFADAYGIEVEFFESFIFLASSTTMSSRAASPDSGWHTDSTCEIIDGDCYNVWIPIYNDSSRTGIEVIPETENKKLYEALGDATYPVSIYLRETAPNVFDIMQGMMPADADMILVKTYNGAVIPINRDRIHIDRFENPEPGDMSIFKQSEIHKGFHEDGIRIQLSLKFNAKSAMLNAKPSNGLYKLFETFSRGQGGLNEYLDFRRLLADKPPLSKHGRLEQDLLVSLLKNTLKEPLEEKI